MSNVDIAVGLSSGLATARATSGQRRIALATAVASLLIFIAVAPFVRTPLPKLPAFIPACQAALFFVDLITAVLLIDQFLRLRRPSPAHTPPVPLIWAQKRGFSVVGRREFAADFLLV
jgi:hypothetical protein